MLKHSYKPLIYWSLALLLITWGTAFLPAEDYVLITAIVDNEITILIALLMYLMYKSQRVYWLSGTSYEEAVAAGSERRMSFRRAHLKIFTVARVVNLAVSFLLLFFQAGIWPQIISLCLIMITAAIFSIKIKL